MPNARWLLALMMIFMSHGCSPLKEQGQSSAARARSRALPEVPFTEGVLGLVDGQEATSSSVPAKYRELLGSVVKKAIEPVAGVDLAEAFAELLTFASHGLGAGLNLSVAAGVGDSSAGASLNLEMLYHRASGAGEIAVYCAPRLSVGEGVGTTAAAGYYFVKTLGCGKSADYEGGILSVPFSLGSYQVAVGMGMNPLQVASFVEFVNDGGAGKGMTSQQVNEEMQRFERVYIEQLKNSNSPLEILALTVYLVFVNRTLEASVMNLIKAAVQTDQEALDQAVQTRWRSNIGLLEKLPLIIERLAKTVVSFELFKKRSYPSLKTIYTRLFEKLSPAEDYVFSRSLLGELTSGMSGCDSVSFSQESSTKVKSIGEITKSFSYTYTVNPEYLNNTDYQRDKKLLLDIDSFADFLDPEKYAQLAATLGKNISNTTLKPAGRAIAHTATEGSEAVSSGVSSGVSAGVDAGSGVASKAVGKLFLGVGEDVASFTGADAFGPLNFLTRLTNLADPRYVNSHCMDPALENSQRVMAALEELAVSALPIP